MNGKSKAEDIVHPHDHDVLSGRGNFVNYHAGNEHFRALVRKHKVAYVACPKPQKGKFSRMIVDEIRERDPPGRFLKQDHETKMWHDIGDKKALDKTRQALREGAPDLMKDLANSDDEDEEEATPNHIHQDYRRQPQAHFGIDDNPYNNMGGLQAISMPPPAVVSSTAGITGLSTASYQTSIGQSRVIPGMINLPSGLDASLRQTTRIQPLSGGGGGEVEHLQKQLNSIFPAEHFEPTPINPNLQLRVRGEMRDHESTSTTSKSQGSVVASRGIERADSLTFDNLFARDQGSATGKATKMGGNSSNHLSAMSFSIGDMSDATNLSAVFEDSMRISDDAPKRLSMSDYAAKKRSISPHGANVVGGIASAKQGHASTMDMSTQTFGQDDLHGATGSLGSSMFNMSFRSKD